MRNSMARISVLALILLIVCCMISTSAFAFPVSSPFGWRIHPITGKWHFHTGIDVQGKYGSRICALFDGEVVWAEVHGGYGNTVLLRHENNRFTLYGHCAGLYVKRAQAVKAGELIATVGSTGVSTGPHLHLEYWVNQRYIDPMTIWKPVRQPDEQSRAEVE